MSSPLDAPLARMSVLLPPMVEADDPRRHVVAVWMRTAAAIRRELEADPVDGFRDPAWTAGWVVAAEDRRLEAFERWTDDGSAPGPWQAVWSAAETTAPGRLVLLALAAHVDYDLPQAVLDVLSDDALDDDDLVALRIRDHAHLDQVLLAHLQVERPFLRTPGAPDLQVHERTLREARPRVWATARALGEARRHGPPALKARVGELGERSARHVERLRTMRRTRLRRERPSLGIALGAAGPAAPADASVRG